MPYGFWVPEMFSVPQNYLLESSPPKSEKRIENRLSNTFAQVSKDVRTVIKDIQQFKVKQIFLPEATLNNLSIIQNQE